MSLYRNLFFNNISKYINKAAELHNPSLQCILKIGDFYYNKTSSLDEKIYYDIKKEFEKQGLVKSTIKTKEVGSYSFKKVINQDTGFEKQVTCFTKGVVNIFEYDMQICLVSENPLSKLSLNSNLINDDVFKEKITTRYHISSVGFIDCINVITNNCKKLYYVEFHILNFDIPEIVDVINTILKFKIKEFGKD